MQYLEELKPGDCFQYNSSYYILSSDFKNNGSKMCLSMANGFSKWLKGDCIVDLNDIFTLDKDSNIITIKERAKDDNTQNKNLS